MLSVKVDLAIYVWSSTWCFWIVYECKLYVLTKSEFQFLGGDSQFSQTWSHNVCVCCVKSSLVKLCANYMVINVFLFTDPAKSTAII